MFGHMPKANAQDAEPDPPATGASTGGTREALLDAAATAIARSGWGAITTRQVAGLAGVNQGLVHYHFGSMDDLRRQAALHALAGAVEAPTLAVLQPGPVADRLEACLAAVGDIDPRSDQAVVLYEAMLASTRDDDLGALLAGFLAEFKALLALRLADDGARHPTEAAALVAAALDGLLLHRIVDPDLDPTTLAGPLLASLDLED